MTVFEMARELGNMLKETEEYKRLSGARYIFDGDYESKKSMSDYVNLRDSIKIRMESGNFSKEDFEEESRKLNKMAEELKSQPVIGELINAENKFNNLANQVMDILRQTITGDDESSCGGNCSGCSGCH